MIDGHAGSGLKHQGRRGFKCSETQLLAIGAMLVAVAIVAGNVFLVSVSGLASVDEFLADMIGYDAANPPPDWAGNWFWHQGAPFKYRILGKLVLWVPYRLGVLLGLDSAHSLYLAYVLSCGLCLALALYLLGVFLLGFMDSVGARPDPKQRLILAGAGMLLFSLSAPVLLFSKFAVHGSPNDFLGYALMLLIVHLAWTGRTGWCVVAAMVAALCRETTLLAPFLVLFIGRIPLRARLAVAASACIVLVSMRLLWPGTYNPFEGALANFEVPLQSLAFLFLTFGPLWLMAMMGYLRLRRDRTQGPDSPVRAMVTSFPWATILTLLVTLLLARVREIRILFVLFLYIVPFALYWLYGIRQRLSSSSRSIYAGLWVLGCAVIAFRIRVWLMPADVAGHQQMESLLGAMFTGFIWDHSFSWVAVLVGYLFLLLLVLPLLWAGAGPGRREAV